MPQPQLHHVVFAIGLERLDRAAEYLSALGFQFEAFELEHLGLQIRLDWDRGFELIAPTAAAPTDGAPRRSSCPATATACSLS